MTDNQQVIIKLIKEINALCAEKGWSYFLDEKYTLEAVRSHQLDSEAMDFMIWMSAKDFKEFATISKEELPENRYVESLYNNPRFPRMVLYYGDTETLDINPSTFGFYDNLGIHITINPLRPQDKTRLIRSIRNKAENAWETYANFKLEGRHRKEAYNLMAWMVRIAGQKRVSSRLFKVLLSPERRTNGNFYRKKYWKSKVLKVDKSEIGECIQVPFEDTFVMVPKDYDNFLTKAFGPEWMDKDKRRSQPNPVRRVTDHSIPFREFFSEAEKQGVDLGALWDSRSRYVEHSRRLDVLKRQRKRIWNQLFLSCDRYYYWNMFRGKKAQLRVLSESGRSEELLEELEPLIDAMRIQNNRRLGLCSDKEIFEMIEKAYADLEDEEKMDWIRQVRRRVPEQHWEPVKLKDYNGNAIDNEEVCK